MKYLSKFFAFSATFAVFSLFLNANISAQKINGTAAGKNSKTASNAALAKVTQIDEVKIKELLKPNGKPLLVNFWATWCVPCREEFPDLVEIDEEFKGKIDFITISLDDPAEINRDVPRFLSEMKAEMPAYLLRTTEEDAVISSIAKDWSGGLPFTVLYGADGDVAHTKEGKIKPDVVREKINSLLAKTSADESFTKGKKDALDDLAAGKLILKNHTCKSRIFTQTDLRRTGWTRRLLSGKAAEQPKPNEPKFELQCATNAGFQEIRYMEGYNSISGPKISEALNVPPVRLFRYGLSVNHPPKITEVIVSVK